jgi:hypothetical protein
VTRRTYHAGRKAAWYCPDCYQTRGYTTNPAKWAVRS